MRKCATDTDGKFEQTESCLYLTERKYHYFYLTDQEKGRRESVVEVETHISASPDYFQHFESPPAFSDYTHKRS